MKYKKNDFWRGILSGYPVCCIDFYINFWTPVKEKHLIFDDMAECYGWIGDVGYIACPTCRIMQIVNVSASISNQEDIDGIPYLDIQN